MVKKLILGMAALLAIATAQGQRFEWTKGYGSREGAVIKGSVADSEGNLYILGEFRGGDTWDGQPLLPITPAGPYHDTKNVLIAKISPSGEMLWKKVIHANNGQPSLGWDIKKVGDTAFACLVETSLPGWNNYCYYLDTLLAPTGDASESFPSEVSLFDNSRFTIFIVFRFHGDVIEQHFLKMTYTRHDDSDYETFMSNGPVYTSHPFHSPSFDIDSLGFIYLSRIAYDLLLSDSISTYHGNIKGIKYWDNNRCVGVQLINEVPMLWYPLLMKFSPHFDSLLDCRYVIQEGDGLLLAESSIHIKLKNNYLYAIGNVNSYGYRGNTLWLDTSLNIHIVRPEQNTSVGYIVKYDGGLTPLWCKYIEADTRGNENIINYRSFFCNIAFAKDSNLVFVSGFLQKTDEDRFQYVVDGTPLNVHKNDAFILSFDADSGVYHSCGVIPSGESSHLGGIDANGNLVAANNRVFLQNMCYGGAVYPNDTLLPENNQPTLGIAIFDYHGNNIKGISYSSHSTRNNPSSITHFDSILYLSNMLTSSATFGNIQVPAQGHFACIAKHVDTAFMTPYRAAAEPDTGDVRVVMVENQGAWTLYPNPFRQRVNIEYQGTELLRTTATLTDATGHSTEVRLSEQGTGRYRLDFADVPQPRGRRALFLTLTTASGRQHTLQLMTAWE